MRNFVVFILIALLGVNVVGAFPLTGGNGMGDGVTLVGTLISDTSNPDEKAILVDVILNNTSAVQTFALVDEEDNFYHGSISQSVGEMTGRKWTHKQGIRQFITFDVPKDAIIKKFVMQPFLNDPVNIEWDIVPSGENGTGRVEILEITEWANDYAPMTKSIAYRVRITNIGNSTMELGSFGLVDINKWYYDLWVNSDEAGTKLLPGESIRTTVSNLEVSVLSEPSIFGWNTSKKGQADVLISVLGMSHKEVKE